MFEAQQVRSQRCGSVRRARSVRRTEFRSALSGIPILFLQRPTGSSPSSRAAAARSMRH